MIKKIAIIEAFSIFIASVSSTACDLQIYRPAYKYVRKPSESMAFASSETKSRLNTSQEISADTTNPIDINVREFGARGDGRTDDSEALQRAVEAAQSSGARLVFPPGTFITSKTIKARLPITITGAKSTTGNFDDISGIFNPDKSPKSSHTQIKKINGNTDGDAVLEVGSNSLVEYLYLLCGTGDGGTGVIDYTDATIPVGTATTSYGLRVTGSNSRIAFCSVTQASEGGFYTTGGATNTFFNTMGCYNRIGLINNSSDSSIESSYFHHNVESGVFLRKGNYVRMINCRIEWNARYGVHAKSGENQFTGNLFDRNGWAGLFLDTGWGATVSGNYFSRNGAGGDGMLGRWGFSTPGTRSYLETPHSESCHIKFYYQRDVSVVGNRFRAGKDDAGGGVLSPAYVYSNAGATQSVVIVGNAGEQAASGGFGGFNSSYPGGAGTFFPNNAFAR